MATLNMKAVCELTGLNSSTLRAWERRYGAIQPNRTSTGHRLYSFQDVERLKLLSGLLAQGHSISNLASLTTKQLREISSDHGVSLERENRIHPLLTQLLDELQEFNLRSISLQLSQIRNLFDVRTFVIEFVAPLLAEVGHQVVKERISIAQEHALSAILRAQLGQIMQGMVTVSLSNKKSPKVVFATPESELHEFGILLSALLGGYWGLEVNYLGPNMPGDSLADATIALDANFLVLGTSPFTNNLPSYLNNLDRAMKNHPCEVLVGGPAKFDVSKVKRKSLRVLRSLEEIDSLFASLSPREKK